MVLQYKIPLLPTQATASYDFQDIADGTGVVHFYAGTAISTLGTTPSQGSTTSYILSQDTFRSAGIETTTDAVVYVGSTYAQSGNQSRTFALSEFNLPKTLQGTAIISSCMKTKNPANGDGYIKPNYVLMKNSTDIGSQYGQEIATTAAGFGSAVNQLVTIDLSSPVHFAKGDVLKLRVEEWGSADAGTSTLTSTFGTDPLNRDGTNITPSSDTTSTTILKASIPFRIDIA